MAITCRAKLISKLNGVAHPRTPARHLTHPQATNPSVHLVFQAIDDGLDSLDGVGLIDFVALKPVTDAFAIGNIYTVTIS